MSLQGISSTLGRRLSTAILVGSVVAGCHGASQQYQGAGAAPGVAVSIHPTTADVAPGEQQAFDAAVTGTTRLSVAWDVSDASCGTVTQSGLFTAPARNATCHVVATSVADPTRTATAVVTVADTVWAPLKVGAGGWITGIDASLDGTTYTLRTDTYGGYVGNPNAGETWQQLVRADTMPVSFAASMGDALAEGVYELRVAPSDGNRLYMVYRKKVYRSTDRGTTWTETAFSYSGPMDPNDGYRMWGEKAAVDPVNPNVVFVGTVGSGLSVTTDGGATWYAPTSVPVATHPAGITGIVFDASSASGGTTLTAYASSNGNGVYRTTDGGATWSLLSGGPTAVTHAAVASDGAYYAVTGSTGLVYRYAAGAWSSSDSGLQTAHTVTTDPFNAARVIAGRDSGNLSISTNRGASWGSGTIWTMTRQATDVPWLAAANESYMSSGGTRLDPVVPNKLWFTEGIGVWYTTAPDNAARTSWTSWSAGIEQLVARDVKVPPGGANVILAGMDRSVWVVPRDNSSYPARYVTMGSSASLIAAWALAYASDSPSSVVAIINRGLAGEPELSGYSLDGGATWTRFPVQPGSGGQCGDVVAPSIDNVIAVIGTRYAYRSTDRGATWTPLSLPGDSGANSSNLHCGFNCGKHILAIDGADPNTIYLYFYTRGLYRSSDGGATWTLATSNTFDGGNMYWQTKLRSVPGKAGHLFLTAGQAGAAGQPNPAATFLWRSTDGGSTWTKVPDLAEPYDVALGKAAPGASYPAIYVVGWYRGIYGIWRSTDGAATWTQIGPFPYGSVDSINAITASQDVFGDVYVAFQGSGWGYGRLR
jgi:hypothetical protein